MTSVVKELDKLLAEAKLVNVNVSALQTNESLTGDQVASIQSIYQRWLHRAYALLPDYFKPRFWEPYDGPQLANPVCMFSEPGPRELYHGR